MLGLKVRKMRRESCMSFWFPKIVDLIPVPLTKMIVLSDEQTSDIGTILDRRRTDAFSTLCSEIKVAGDMVGWPAFLRTGQGSGKHRWNETCFLQNYDQIGQHIYNLIEWSCMVDFLGLPYNIWVVREMLPVNALFRCQRYGGMPIVHEVRIFARNGDVQCVHPYWPEKALQEGCPDISTWRELLPILNASPPKEVLGWASDASRAVDGYWSIDFLETKRGWFLTDMARGDESFHADGCHS